MTPKTALRLLAWLLLAALIFVTLSPINLRPVSPLPTQLERAIAPAIVGFVFAIAYPKHLWAIALVVIGSTCCSKSCNSSNPRDTGASSMLQ